MIKFSPSVIDNPELVVRFILIITTTVKRRNHVFRTAKLFAFHTFELNDVKICLFVKKIKTLYRATVDL